MATYYFQYSLTRNPVPRISKDSLSCWKVLEGYLDFRRISKGFWRISWFLENVYGFMGLSRGGKSGFLDDLDLRGRTPALTEGTERMN